MTSLITLFYACYLSCNSTSDQSPFEQLALPAPPVSNGAATSAPKSDLGIDLLSWDDTPAPATAQNSLALVPVTDPLADSTSSNQNALAIVDTFSQHSTANSNAQPADPFGLNPSSAIPGSQPYNTPTQQPFQSQQPPQQAALYPNGGAVNPGTSYDQASQFNNVSSGWNGQAANPAVSLPEQALNYGMARILISTSFLSFYQNSLYSYESSFLSEEHVMIVYKLCR
jgi:hypothetical protein